MPSAYMSRLHTRILIGLRCFGGARKRQIAGIIFLFFVSSLFLCFVRRAIPFISIKFSNINCNVYITSLHTTQRFYSFGFILFLFRTHLLIFLFVCSFYSTTFRVCIFLIQLLLLLFRLHISLCVNIYHCFYTAQMSIFVNIYMRSTTIRFFKNILHQLFLTAELLQCFRITLVKFCFTITCCCAVAVYCWTPVLNECTTHRILKQSTNVWGNARKQKILRITHGLCVRWKKHWQ